MVEPTLTVCSVSSKEIDSTAAGFTITSQLATTLLPSNDFTVIVAFPA